LVLPVVEIFMAAYIMRYFASTSYVAIFQVAMYSGIIITSLTNGFLLKHFKVAHLYSFGILLSGLSMVGMMFVKDITLFGLIISGTLIGAASGFFGNVVFTNGHYVKGDDIFMYYGASDEVICGARLSISEILSTLI